MAEKDDSATLSGGMVDELTDEEKKLIEGENLDDDDIEIPDLEEDDLVAPGEEAEAKPVKTDEEEASKDQKTDEEDEDGEETVEVENKGRFVRHGALHAEREKHKKTKTLLQERDRQFTELQQKFARADERLNLLYQAAAAEEKQAPTGQEQAPDGQQALGEKPDKYEKPFEYMEWMEARVEQLINQGNQTREQATQQAQAEAAYDEARDWFQADAKGLMEYKDEEGNQPYADFLYAYAHLINSRDQELQMMGYNDSKQRAQIMENEEMAIVQQAAQNRQSPSAMIYNLARQRGYVFNPEWVQGQGEAAKPDGEAKPNGEAKQVQSPTDRIKQMNKAQSANKSLSGASGAQGKPQLTAEYLADLPEDEFDKLVDKMSEKQKRMYFGG